MDTIKKRSRDQAKQYSKYPRQRNSLKTKEIKELYDEEEAMPTWKLFMIIGIVILCFAILYPHIIGPLINSYFSPTNSQKRPSSPPVSPVHPALNNARAGGPRPGGPNMHSAYRMAGQHQQAETSTGRGGMFGWLLPFYTVGVMIFLVYTLYKMMYGGKGKKNKRRYQRSLYDSDYNDETDDSDESEDIDNMSSNKMRKLQSQLKETELAMSKILLQLENMQNIEMNVRQTVQATLDKDNKDERSKEEQKSLQERLQQNANDIKKTLDEFQTLNKFYSDLKEISNHGDLRKMNVDDDYNSSSEKSDDEDDFENFSNTSSDQIQNDENKIEEIEVSKTVLEDDNTKDTGNGSNNLNNQDYNNVTENDFSAENIEFELTSISKNEKNTLVEKNNEQNDEDNCEKINDIEKSTISNENVSDVTKKSRKERKKKYSRREK